MHLICASVVKMCVFERKMLVRNFKNVTYAAINLCFPWFYNLKDG